MKLLVISGSARSHSNTGAVSEMVRRMLDKIGETVGIDLAA
ncbi:NAD(P)H-dependent oxidoreductase [Paenibacillus sp. DMB20]|nr:NAD(P)H-dependent oxidoreductase [Paenibacillus sp. DMB20]